jgi:hypothetical protein
MCKPALAALIIRTALVIVFCGASVSCGSASKKADDASRRVEGSCGWLRLRLYSGDSAQGAQGILQVHGVECGAARRWLAAYAVGQRKVPRGYYRRYTCRDAFFCWRGASASNAEHAPHWFRLSFKFAGRGNKVEGSCGAYVFSGGSPSRNPATFHVHGVKCGIARILQELEWGWGPPGYACGAHEFICWRGAAHADQAPHWFCISFRTEQDTCSRLGTRESRQ